MHAADSLNNDFKGKCLEQYYKLLEAFEIREISREEGEVKGFLGIGTSGTYYKSVIEIEGHSIEVYVYEEEAQLVIDHKDNPRFESPDYESGDDLIEDFLLKLKKTITSFLPTAK
jgi:hypothetical protein